MPKRTLWRIPLIVVAVMAVIIAGALVLNMSSRGGSRDSYGTIVGYRDEDKQQPVSVRVTYTIYSPHTESYPITPRMAPSMPVSWDASDTVEGTVSLQQDGKQLISHPLSGTGCVKWPVTASAYQIVISLAPGTGVVKVAWDDEATCG